MQERSPATAAKFPTTRWVDLVSLREDGCDVARERIVRDLCQNYWFPLYAFARMRGMRRPDAEDAVQTFFLNTADADFFRKAEQEKGKFRTFLLTAFTRLIADRTERDNAQKRGGKLVHLSIDTDEAEAWLLADTGLTEGNETLAFERHWAKSIIRFALASMEEDSRLSPKTAKRFQILSRFLTPGGCMDYPIRQAADDLGMTLASCQKSIQRLRADFRIAVRQQVANTLRDPSEAAIDEEMIQLQKSLLEG